MKLNQPLSRAEGGGADNGRSHGEEGERGSEKSGLCECDRVVEVESEGAEGENSSHGE